MTKKAFIFPGQGSQSVGMCSSIISTSLSKKYFYKTSNALGYNLLDICKNGPNEELTKTINTQPSIFTLSVIIDKMLKEEGVIPCAVAGHSLGEYSALVSANVLSFEDALNLIILRAQEMEKANNSSEGTMAAVLNASIEEINLIIEQVDGILVIANYNTPSQIVLSGEKQTIETAIKISKEISNKIRCIPLNVSGAFHSPLMKFARVVLSDRINLLNFNNAKVPIYQNINGKSTQDASTIKDNLILQLENPVQWFNIIINMKNDAQIFNFVECGPGKVLMGINRRISKDFVTLSTTNLESIKLLCTKN